LAGIPPISNCLAFSGGRARGVVKAVAMFDPNGSADILAQMKGVVLASGIGARLLLLTKIAKEKSSPRS
jgi:hypothetical protein